MPRDHSVDCCLGEERGLSTKGALPGAVAGVVPPPAAPAAATLPALPVAANAHVAQVAQVAQMHAAAWETQTGGTPETEEGTEKGNLEEGYPL
eukprot:g22835.t1